MTLETTKARLPEESRTHTEAPPKAPPNHTTIEAALAEALARYGVTLAPKASGRFERFDALDKPKGNGNGWYRIHSPQAASFGIWHMDLAETVTLSGSSDPEAAATARLDAMRARERHDRERRGGQGQGDGQPLVAPLLRRSPGWWASGYRPTTCASAATCC